MFSAAGLVGRAARSEIIEDGVGTSHCALRLVTTESSLPKNYSLALAFVHLLLGEASGRRKVSSARVEQCDTYV